MSSKEKDNRLNKVKQFFRSVGRGTGGNAKEERDLVGLSLESELRPETPVAQRCKTIKDLGDHFGSVNLEESSVTKLWDLTKDLIVDNKSTEHRQTTLTFYRILIQTQYKNLTLMREHFFHVIQNHEVGEDLRHRLELLIALTENGKDITHFEEKIGKFMLQWLPSIYQGNLLGQYLDMLVNLIKFNAAHLDNEIVVGIVQNACQLSSWNVQDDAIRLQCLNILELVMCYTIFPNETLPLCVMTLCRTVNYIPFCHTSWKNMKKLLGTNLGYSSLLIMCNILNDKANYNDPDLLRGAVFHINMGIFGSTHALVFSPMFSTTSSVLMSFLHALESTKLIVTYEVILSIRRVVSKYCEELPERIWDIICEILSAIAGNIAYYEKEGLRKDMTLQQNFHETIDDIEKLMHADKLQANQDLIYDLIERVSESRPEISVLNLIDYRSKKISPTKPEWLTVLNDFVCRFYRIPNTNIRVKTIHSLMQIMDASRASYEEEILQRIVIPQFSGIASEPDLMIRVVVCKALVECALHCDTKRCGELIDIMEKVLNRPFEQYALDESVCKSEDEIQDVATVVDGLIRIFVVKLYRLPSSHAIRVFNILVSHVEQHYQKPKIFEHVNLVRSKIFTWMLKARANASYHIGYPDHESGTIRFSPYLGIDSSLPIHDISGHSVPAGQEHIAINFTTISIRRACKIIVKCIEEDRDYHIFQLVIKELPQILQNKALILGNDIESLAAALCNALPDPKSPLRSFHTAKPPSEEFNALLLPAIASLVIYHQYISSDLKLRMIEAVKVVIRSNANAGICINTLSIMILEMPETLSRQLAEVLLEISKMSRTALVAIPVLEFLSILSRLPNDLFANFVPRHYMYVFAVSLSYTKPNPYDHYTVSLAHHVMTGWLLKCKMSMRKNFVMYIISGLQTDTNKLNKDHSMRNEDSSSRQRSTSLTERVSRNRDNAIATSDNHESIQAELAETCIDFLARHTFSPCSTLPKRLPAVECMLKDGPSQTWLVGHNLVTITTSGCPSPPKANGLCDRCSLLMNKSNSPFTKSDVSSPYAGGPISPEMLGTTAPTIPTETANDLQQPNRRYTKASLQYSSGTDSGTSTDLTSTSTSSSSQHQTHRQTSNSSSVSLEALSRRGSNPEPENRIESSSVFGNSLNQLSNASSSTVSSQQPTCARSCTGWAEIYIRRPTGNISWIMHIQNPIANDCIGTDLPLSDLITLFLPTMHGGVFGPDFVEESKLLSPAPLIPILSPRDPAEQERKDPRRMDAAKLAVARVRALQRQEEITSAVASGPIDIPKTSKRGKDPSGSVSDGEADEETTPFEDGRTRARNPVRRVNSSPEMSSSLRKPTGKDFNPAGLSQFIQIDPDEAAKKKIVVSSGYTKDIRVSCEAIPEEIAGSTPPSQTDSLKDEEKVQKADLTKKGLDVTSGGKESSLPPKQHSADDVTNQISVNPVTGSASATSLKIPFDLQKINTSVKPLQSTAPLSPRLLAKNAAIKVASFSSNVGGGGMGGMSDYSNNNVEMIRGRSKTISVVREVNGKSRPPLALSSFGAAKAPMNSKLGISPSFVFLQLFHNGQLQSSDPPLKVGSDNMAALTLLDLIPPFETHKFGVLYVGPGQCNNEVGILRNRHGSVRYVEFLRSIGTLVSLKDAKENNLFVNMDTNGSDGNFTYIWKDDVVQITFHVATLMPNHDNDPNCNEKKKHIGNDYVSIVYNESGEEYNLNTIKGQFNYACVVVQPLELNMNRVFVKARQEIEKFVCHPEPKIVSDRSAPLLARQLALHANLASHVSQSMRSKNPYASNWLERLRKIKHLRTKLLNDIKQKRDAGKDEPSSWW